MRTGRAGMRTKLQLDRRPLKISIAKLNKIYLAIRLPSWPSKEVERIQRDFNPYGLEKLPGGLHYRHVDVERKSKLWRPVADYTFSRSSAARQYRLILSLYPLNTDWLHASGVCLDQDEEPRMAKPRTNLAQGCGLGWSTCVTWRLRHPKLVAVIRFGRWILN